MSSVNLLASFVLTTIKMNGSFFGVSIIKNPRLFGPGICIRFVKRLLHNDLLSNGLCIAFQRYKINAFGNVAQ